MTDSVLDALLKGLVGDFDRTLLVVIADRCDEIEDGSGIGWRVLWETGRAPELSGTVFYWRRPFWSSLKPDPRLLSKHWFERLKKGVTYLNGNYRDYRSLSECYADAAETYCRLSPKLRAVVNKELGL